MIVDVDGTIVYITSELNGVRLRGFHFLPTDFVYLNPPILLLKGTVANPERVISTGLAKFVDASLGRRRH